MTAVASSIPSSASPELPPVSIETKARPIAVISHPRSGTHLMIDGLRHFFIETYRRQRFNQPVHDLYVNLDRLNPSHPFAASEEKIRKAFATCPKRVIIKTHCSTKIDQVGEGTRRALAKAILDASDVAYVVRDPRPVMTSYMALRPLWFPDSPRDIATFLRTAIDGASTPAANWAAHVQGWLDTPGVRVVKFEDLMRDYPATVAQVGKDLGLTSNRYPIRIFPKPSSIRANKIRRVFGIQNCSSIDNLRMAFPTPDWKKAMTKEDLELIKREAGEVMARVGYRW